MAEVFVLALSFPSVVFTVLLGVVLLYWTFVMIGVIHIGEGSEGALEGHVDGATKGMLEAGVDHMAGGDAHASSTGHLEGAGPGEAHLGQAEDGDTGQGAIAFIMNALHLRSVPATVVFSLIITFAWLVCVVTMQFITRMVPPLHGPGLSAGVLAASVLLALPLTSLAARPLAKVFAPKHAPLKSSFIGRTCVVRTGSVTTKFGEATLPDGGAGLVLRIRIEDGRQLARGEQALIVDYDAERGALAERQQLSTRPAGATGDNFPADLHVHPGGRFVYASNRGDDTLAVFAVGDGGRLSLVQTVPTGGRWPRNFALDPAGRLLLVANQRSDSVVAFRVDQTTGRLTPAGSQATVPAPVCLLFAEPASA